MSSPSPERVVAVVVPREGATIDPDELVEWCRGRLAGFKRPRQLLVVDALPTNASFAFGFLRLGPRLGLAPLGLDFLGGLLFAFFGLTRLVFAIVDGRPRPATRLTAQRFPETAGVIIPPLILLGFSLWLGVATPDVLREAWTAAVAQLYPAP